MDLGTIRRCEPFVGRMLGAFGDGLLEALQGFADRVGHGGFDVFFWVVPIDGQSAVLVARWVDGDGLMLLERIKEVGGVVGGKELYAKVVYSKGEVGGKGRMDPKARSIFHRVVSMGLEVSYKDFVGDDAGFLKPIHPLSDINVDVAAQVRNLEEVLFNDHLIGNVLYMYPHVLEVGHWFIEVVVDDVFGDVVGPFAGVGYDRVEVDI